MCSMDTYDLSFNWLIDGDLISSVGDLTHFCFGKCGDSQVLKAHVLCLCSKNYWVKAYSKLSHEYVSRFIAMYSFSFSKMLFPVITQFPTFYHLLLKFQPLRITPWIFKMYIYFKLFITVLWILRLKTLKALWKSREKYRISYLILVIISRSYFH